MELYGNKCNILYRLQRYQEAVECYDKALAINPKDAIAWQDKGDALYKLGDKKNAKNISRKQRILVIPNFMRS
jgi:tetratricopeptide (TPR) repeat protein